MTPQAGGLAMAGIGAATTGLGLYESGQQQRSAYDYNADVTMLNMRDQVAANQQQYSSLVGKQAGAYAASGVDIASGSPLLVMAATAARGAQQNKQIEQSATQEATLQRYYGKVAAWSGTMSGIGSFLTGISKAATGYYGATAKTPSPTIGNIPMPEGTMG